MSHDILLVKLQPGLSLGWDGSYPSSESRQNVWQSSYSHCETASVTAQQCCSWATGSVRGQRTSKAPYSLQGMQETLILTSGAVPLHLSQFHWLLPYTSLWFTAHGSLVSTLKWDFQRTIADFCFCVSVYYKLHELNNTTINFPKQTRAFKVNGCSLYLPEINLLLVFGANLLEICNLSQWTLICFYCFSELLW